MAPTVGVRSGRLVSLCHCALTHRDWSEHHHLGDVSTFASAPHTGVTHPSSAHVDALTVAGGAAEGGVERDLAWTSRGGTADLVESFLPGASGRAKRLMEDVEPGVVEQVLVHVRHQLQQSAGRGVLELGEAGLWHGESSLSRGNNYIPV